MTTGIKFSNKNSNRNEAVVVADHGDRLEVRVWVNPTSRFRTYTEMIEKRWVRKQIRLSRLQIEKLGVAA